MNQSSLDTFLRPLPLIFTFLIPALTMRTFSEEFKSGTIEYLATLPIRDYEIVLGKYLGALGWLGILMVFTLAFPLTVIGDWAAGLWPDAERLSGGHRTGRALYSDWHLGFRADAQSGRRVYRQLFRLLRTFPFRQGRGFLSRGVVAPVYSRPEHQPPL